MRRRATPSAKLRKCFDKLRLSGVWGMPQTPSPLMLSLSKHPRKACPA